MQLRSFRIIKSAWNDKSPDYSGEVMTFSIVARCETTGQFGVAISSSSPAVAARCVYTRAGVGSVASQNITDPSLGPLMLNLMEKGQSADDAIASLLSLNPHMDYRQILAVDIDGQSAVHSGTNALGIWTAVTASNAAAGGNLLAHDSVPQAMLDCFEKSNGHLGDRLLESLKSGLAAGGEAGPVHSAGMQLCDQVSWPVADLRCDWTDSCPIAVVEAAWLVYKPQLAAYVTRALNPSEAPSYGVPGE